MECPRYEIEGQFAHASAWQEPLPANLRSGAARSLCLRLTSASRSVRSAGREAHDSLAWVQIHARDVADLAIGILFGAGGGGSAHFATAMPQR